MENILFFGKKSTYPFVYINKNRTFAAETRVEKCYLTPKTRVEKCNLTQKTRVEKCKQYVDKKDLQQVSSMEGTCRS